jgi:hypothetical protein
MKKLMMTLALVTATGCTTVGTTQSVAKDEAGKTEQSEEEGLRAARQQALLEALEGKNAK